MLTKQQDVRRCCSDGRIWNKLEEEEDEQCLSRENKTGIALRLVWFSFFFLMGNGGATEGGARRINERGAAMACCAGSCSLAARDGSAGIGDGIGGRWRVPRSAASTEGWNGAAPASSKTSRRIRVR